jgi:hypothetical protein
MGLLDKVKSAAETAATKTKEGIDDVQTKRELGQAYDELGKTTFDLVDKGEITHAGLDQIVAKIRDLRQKAEDGDGDGDGAAASTADAPTEDAAAPTPPA